MEYSNGRTWRYHSMNADQQCTGSGRNHISDKNGLRGDMPRYVQKPFAAPKATFFSFAMTVMDKVKEGWNEERWVGSIFAARMWVYTKAVLCDGRGRGARLDPRQMLQISWKV